MSRLSELGGKRLPFLRWSFVRMLLGSAAPDDRVAGGRRARAGACPIRRGRGSQGDLDDVIRVIDEFAYRRSFLINVGDEKGEILDAAIRRTAAAPAARAGHLLRLQRAAHRRG